MLNILEGYDLAKLGRGEKSLHTMIEAMKRAYADRAVFMGDPDAVKMPIAGLISKKYAAALRASIGDKATPAADIRPGKPADYEGKNTTHFSVIDRDGNAVSNTYTLNFSYGLGLVADGTGVLLNNELDDFTAKPGAANAYEPGRLQRQSAGAGQAPAVVDDADHRAERRQAVSDHRLARRQPHHLGGAAGHHECDRFPYADRPGGERAAPASSSGSRTKCSSSRAFAPDVLDALKARGHKIVPTEPHTSANSIVVVPKTEFTPQGYVGAADTRTRGALAAGY